MVITAHKNEQRRVKTSPENRENLISVSGKGIIWFHRFPEGLASHHQQQHENDVVAKALVPPRSPPPISPGLQE
jgi:hypothetical protein